MHLLYYLLVPVLLIPLAISTFYYLTDIKKDGTVNIKRAGSNSTIEIYRDDYGVPRIFTDSFTDALYGLGWVHAQDRLWSINIKRCLFSGRLAEIFGPEVIRIDKYMRSIGFLRSAHNDLQYLDVATRSKLQAYADGVNDYAATLKILPTEFLLTRTTFSKWEITDVLVFHKFMSWTLTHDWSTQLFRTRLATLLGKERACEILACSSEYLYDSESTIMNDDELKASGLYEPAPPRDIYNHNASATLDDIINQVSSKEGDTKEDPTPAYSSKTEKTYFNMVSDLMSGLKGSNSWVISGQHTKSGKPLLANDPHLDNSMPSSWSQVQLSWGNKSFIGAIIAGTPNMGVGKTDDMAWGATTLYGDTSDIYLERINTAGTKYFFEGKWHDLIRYREPIRVKGYKDVNFVVNATRHGPILTDIMNTFHPGLPSQNMLKGNFSFSWTGHVNKDNSMAQLFRMFEYTKLEDLKEDQRQLYNPSQNIVMSFRERGDIVYKATGLLPIRGSQYDGAFVKDGTKKSHEWKRYATRWEIPYSINPQKGYIVTANNKFATDNIKNQLSRTMSTTARAARITELIQSQINKGRKFTVEDMKKIQLDTVDVYARDNVNKVLKIVDRYKEEVLGGYNSSLEEITQLLNGWRGSFERDSVAASVFSVWEYLFNLKLFSEVKMDEEERGALFTNNVYDQFFFRYIGKWALGQNLSDSICVNEENKDRSDKPCAWNVIHAMCETYNYMNNLLGTDKNNWKWGNLHQMHYNHAPFSSSFFRVFYHRNKPAGGNKRTPNVASYYASHHNFNARASANLRIIAGWSEEDRDSFIIDTGSSEGLYSGHYDDQQDLMLGGGYLDMNLVTKDQASKMKHKLLLVSKPSNDKEGTEL